MLTAKEFAHRIVSGCGHSAPILIPCADCVEAQMKKWEQSVRDDFKYQMRVEWEQMTLRVSAAEKAAAESKEALSRANSNIITLQEANRVLSERLREAKKDVAEARTQLHAEQAVKTERQMRARIAAK